MTARRAVALLLPIALAAGGARAADTRAIFEHYSPAVIKILVTEVDSGAKAVIGSGFLASDEGHVATNYHVFAKLVRDPERYRAQCQDADGRSYPLELLGFDVVHDLAIARAAGLRGLHLEPVEDEPDQGARLFAFGFPFDLGATIVEGTHNGLLRHSRYEKIHFTGSVNPGMSGGPAILEDGRVVGVNVASAGNQVSFLAPSAALRALLDEVRHRGSAPATGMLDEVRQQVLESQDSLSRELLGAPLPTTKLGSFLVPSELSPAFRCWADAWRREKQRFERLTHSCSTDDYVFLYDGHWAGVMSFRHDLISSEELNRFQFAQLYSHRFGSSYEPVSGDEEDVTRFRCTTDVVEHAGQRFKVAFCARAYRKLAGLYDVIQKSALLGVSKRGLVSTLVLSGVSFDNGHRLGRRFLEAIRWAP